MSYGLFAVAILFVIYGLISKRLSTTAVTGPMLFVFAGVLIGSSGFGVIDAEATDRSISLVLEATLAIVLFSDAAAINSSNWREEAFVPGRLLVAGLPLTIFIGLVAAAAMFTELSYWEAGIIAAILAPTDAALGQAVISNPRVPRLIRQGLATESGLNDGIALTFVVIFLGGAEEALTGGSLGTLLSFLGQEILAAAAIGIGIGWIGATALVAAARRDWVSPVWLQIGTLSVGIAAYGLAVPLGASGFIAAWLTGLMLGRVTRDKLEDASAFSETLGSGLTMASFMIFGAVLLGPAVDQLTWGVALYAVLSLAVIRMIAVAFAMIGSDLQLRSVLFLGWFGPRGLASIVLAGVVVEGSTLPGTEMIITVAMITVGISVFTHGATSWIGSQSYGNWWAQHEPGTREAAEGETVGDVTTPHRFRAPGLSTDATDSPPDS
jgi:NhaP-type Na+/H+ or K+/H+ antiporter